MTNREAFRQGLVPCEVDPRTGDIAYLREVFHAQAIVTVGREVRLGRLRVCESCRMNFFKRNKIVEEVEFP